METSQTNQYQASKRDKVAYTQHWIELIRHATNLRINRDNGGYIVAMKMLVSSLLSEERKDVRAYITEKHKGQFDNMVELEQSELYDDILEKVIDVLQEKGYLTKDTIIPQGVASL